MPSSANRIAELNELLLRSARGDRAAFARLYAASAPRLFGLAIRMLKRRDLAEEVLQEVFVSVWRNAACFDPARGGALAWMASILRNRSLDSLRAHRPEDPLEERPEAIALADPAPSPLERSLQSAEAQALRRCLETLEEGPRDAILQVYYLGLTHAELAARSGIALGTLKSWIRRGLVRLKGCLER
jgi:RNA polymerase sigma-70 factor (ECF subfamily)